MKMAKDHHLPLNFTPVCQVRQQTAVSVQRTLPHLRPALLLFPPPPPNLGLTEFLEIKIIQNKIHEPEI